MDTALRRGLRRLRLAELKDMPGTPMALAFAGGASPRRSVSGNPPGARRIGRVKCT